MDHSSAEINVLLPAMFGVVVLMILSLVSIGLSYALRFKVIDIEVAPVVTNVLKGFGIFGFSLCLIVILSLIVLELYAP